MLAGRGPVAARVRRRGAGPRGYSLSGGAGSGHPRLGEREDQTRPPPASSKDSARPPVKVTSAPVEGNGPDAVAPRAPNMGAGRGDGTFVGGTVTGDSV